MTTRFPAFDAQPGIFTSNSATKGVAEPFQSGLLVNSASAAAGHLGFHSIFQELLALHLVSMAEFEAVSTWRPGRYR